MLNLLNISNVSQIQNNYRMEEWAASSLKSELNDVALIARRNVSFNLVNCLVSMLKHIANDSKSIKKMSCG